VGQICEGGGSTVTPEPVIEPVNEPKECSNGSKPKRKRRQRKEYPPEYETLWQTYPLRCEDKAAKADIFERWQEAVDDGAEPERIIEAARSYAKEFGADEYRKGLRGWLRNKAFDAGLLKREHSNGAGKRSYIDNDPVFGGWG
jgi:hypothetical protein